MDAQVIAETWARVRDNWRKCPPIEYVAVVRGHYPATLTFRMRRRPEGVEVVCEDAVVEAFGWEEMNALATAS